MPCGHALAARAIRFDDLGDPVTRCWACEVERDIELTEKARVIARHQYWKEAQRASRARAKGYNNAVEYSGPIAHNAQRPPVRLYSESEGVDVPEYRRDD
jgi:hypothetical protein